MNEASRRCGAAEVEQTECALACGASQRAACVGATTFEACVGFCLEQTGFVRDLLPACLPQNSAVNACTAGVSSDPTNWECFEPFGAFAVGPCAAELEALGACFSQ